MPKRGRTHLKVISLIYSKLFLVVGGIVLIFIVYTLGKGFIHKGGVSSEIKELKDEIVRLDTKNSDLSQLLGYLESEEFIKQEGKVKFGLREQGEQLVVLNEYEPEKRKLEVTAEDKVEVANPQRWWNYFFN